MPAKGPLTKPLGSKYCNLGSEYLYRNPVWAQILHYLSTWTLRVTAGHSRNPKGPCTQYLGTWDLGSSNYSTGVGLGTWTLRGKLCLERQVGLVSIPNYYYH